MKVKELNSHIIQIVDGYKQQHRCYQQLQQLSGQLFGKLEALVAADDAGAIQQVLLERGELIDAIERINKNVSAHQEEVVNLLHLKEFNLEKVQDLIHPTLRKELREQQEAIEQVIKAIIDLDSGIGEILKKQKQNVTGELKKIQQCFELRRAYLDRPAKFPEPRFIDKKK